MLNLYAETALELAPATTASRVEFQIPRKNGSYNKSRNSGNTRMPGGFADDENEFATRYLATASSLYFRETKHYPRVFHWRILQDCKVLEVQPVDLTRSEKEQKEAYLTLSFGFQDQILPLGVAFADPPKADELHIFVCTTKNEIFNLRIPIDYFRSSSCVSQQMSEWCKPVDVSSLTIDTVYNIYASSPFEVFVAFIGGRIQALRRKADNEHWTQEYYDDSSWGSTLRGMVSRRGQQQIERGTARLATTTVQAMVASPDTNYLYTMCLNHTLRVWHLPSGKLVDTRDLLNVVRDAGERTQLSPSEPGLVRLVRHPKGRHPMLVTYTPHEGGQFKFWNIKGGLTDPLTIEDKYPKLKFSPPDPDPTGNTIWSLIGFEIIPGSEIKPSQMWLLWRNNNYHQVYTLHFDFPTLGDAWESNWVKAAAPTNRPRGPDLVLSDPQDVTSKWLDFLFFPGRYSTIVLEIALSRYQSLTTAKTPHSQRQKSLRDRLCSTIASQVSIRKYDDMDVDYDHFAVDTDHQWRNYWRIVENFNDGRFAPLSLSFDTFSDMAWVSMSDFCIAVRECSKTELLQLNNAENLEDLDEIAAERWPHRKAVADVSLYTIIANVLGAAKKFRKSFTPELTNDLWAAVEEEMYTQSEIPTPDRIVLIFNQIGFSEGLSEGAEEQLLRDLQPAGGVESVNNEIVLAIIDLLSSTTKRPKSSLRNTVFGSKLLSAALLDEIVATRQVLLDLLTLTVFIDESDNFEPPQLFEQILSALRAQERSFWLATHFRHVPVQFLGPSAKLHGRGSTELDQQNARRVTVLEDVLVKNIRPQPAVDRPMMYLLTDLVSESQRWISGKDSVTPEDAAVHIQCDLLVHDDIELATDFLKFQPSTPWSTYVKGRLRLARAEYVEASVYFRKSAYTLACGKAVGDLKEYSAGLLSILDAEHFNNGLPRYFQHIMTLFESEKAHSQAAEYAHLSIEALSVGEADPVPNFRKEILSRLFTAELKCAKFEAAYTTLVEIPDAALQKSSVIAMVNAVLDLKSSMAGTSDALRTLQSLPWSLHPNLAAHLDQHLLLLAKKQTSVPSLGQWSFNGPIDYLGILHAFRLSKNDYRGATSILFDRLRIVQKSGKARSEPQATSIRHALLALINALTCVTPDEAYILVKIDDDPRLQGMKRRRETTEQQSEVRKRKRIVITLDDLRREYQQILDKCSRIERGDFDFDIADESEEEIEEATQLNGSHINSDVMEL